MHKIVLKLFLFLKNCVQILKIFIMFSVLMLILYWIQNLTGDFWSWSSFMAPWLDLFIDLGNYIAPGSIEIFGTVFSFKYVGAIFLFLLLYGLVHLMFLGLCFSEICYEKSRKLIRKFEENCFNHSLENKNIKEQKKLNSYQIYVEARVKSGFMRKEYNINIEEQKNIMLRFLTDKTGINPEKYCNGFLFSFNSFEQIDEILDTFNKLLKSDAPLDYIICVQIKDEESQVENRELKHLISLEMLNKIITLANTAYRYGFNDVCKYEFVQQGVYQSDNKTFEVQEFVQKN